jgi:dTDP-4-dehydrorhamnose reductase
MKKLNKKTIVVTGGRGRFASTLKDTPSKYTVFYPDKKQLNILDLKNIKKYLKKVRPKYLIHLAGLSRPMNSHDKYIKKSIDLNIIGTSNITKVCSDMKIKLVYFSTNFVYPGIKGKYKETDPILPFNNYAWSKLGGECAVQMYKQSLILRVCMTEYPFIHKKAFFDVKNNFIFHADIAKILFRIIDHKGVINIGGKTNRIYDFAKKNNPSVKKIYARRLVGKHYPLNQDMDIKKLKTILK